MSVGNFPSNKLDSFLFSEHRFHASRPRILFEPIILGLPYYLTYKEMFTLPCIFVATPSLPLRSSSAVPPLRCASMLLYHRRLFGTLYYTYHISPLIYRAPQLFSYCLVSFPVPLCGRGRSAWRPPPPAQPPRTPAGPGGEAFARCDQ